MGRDKASLPFGDETLLSHVVAVVSAVVDEVLVVPRQGQELPPLPDHCRIARDDAEGFGPLAGLAAGLEATACEQAFLTACDAPLLREAYVERLFELAHGHPAAVPFIDGHYMVTSAIYGKALAPIARELIRQERRRPLFLVEAVDTRIIQADELRACDPELDSLRNCNTPEEYQEALRFAGLL
jgi:molybdopterin-guanine dinucleotide biosynthesis protein A